MAGGHTFYEAMSQYYLLWPVRGEGNEALRCTWPKPRFEIADDIDKTRFPEAGKDVAAVIDHLTGLH